MPMIEVSNLSKEFGKIVAVDGVSFTVEKGEIFGFLGPNGAGKTTVINMLNTLLTPTSGVARVAGHDVDKNPNGVRASIGVVPQEVVLEIYMTARENLQFYADLYHIPKKEAHESIKRLLELVELSERADDEVKTFSGGMKRRLEIAKALLHNPKVIFMDEPTLGLDPQTRRRIWEYIKMLNERHNITIFLTTHYLEEADFLCDRVAIINKGKIEAMDTPAKLKENLIEGSIVDIKIKNSSNEFIDHLKGIGYEPKSLGDGNIRVLISKGKQAVPQMFKIANELGVEIDSISMHEPSLEDVFIHYTGKKMVDENDESGDRRIVRMFR